MGESVSFKERIDAMHEKWEHMVIDDGAKDSLEQIRTNVEEKMDCDRNMRKTSNTDEANDEDEDLESEMVQEYLAHKHHSISTNRNLTVRHIHGSRL